MKFKTDNIISFMIAIALLVISLYNFIIKRENSSFINIIIAILFIIFSILFFLITDSTFYTAYKERNTKTLFVKYIVADSPN